jgi:predicted nuclease with RNAse H fold
MSAPRVTIGIDLSADPKKTALCIVDWEARAVRLRMRPVHDEHIVEEVRNADAAAIDVPLGWPDAFVDALRCHSEHLDWPPLGVEPPADRKPLRFRATDLHVQSAGARPLSVSTDRIGVSAMRGARIQALLEGDGVAVDRSGMSGRLSETYPAAALRAWGLVCEGYKGKDGATVRVRLLQSLFAECGVFAPAAADCLSGCDDDDLDAFVCAVVARAVQLGNTNPPRPDELEVARREGWIHVPNAALRDIMS